jgi:hypothetical protein
MNLLVFLTALAGAITFMHPTYSEVDTKLNMSGYVISYYVLHPHEFRPKCKIHADKETACKAAC